MDILLSVLMTLAALIFLCIGVYPLSIEKMGYDDGYQAGIQGDDSDPLVHHSSYLDSYDRGYSKGTAKRALKDTEETSTHTVDIV